MFNNNHSYLSRASKGAFNIFQVYLYFIIYRQYFVLKFEHFHEYLFKIRSQEEPNTILNG